MRLSKLEKEFLYHVLDNLTDSKHLCEIGDDECKNYAWPIYRKLRKEVRGY